MSPDPGRHARSRRWPGARRGQPPLTVEIISPADGAVVGAGDVVALRGRAVNADVSDLRWKVDGEIVGHGELVSYTFATQGDHTVALEGDAPPARSARVSHVVHVTEPAGFSVRIVSPNDGDYVGTGESTFVAEARDGAGNLKDNVSFEWYSNVDGFLGTGPSITVRLSYLLDAPHYVTVTARDAQGHMVVDTIAVTTNRVT